MPNTPRLLDQLVDLTSIRDLELLEFSLLKTLNGFFHPRSLVLLRLDSKGRPLTEIRFSGGACEVRHEGISLTEELHRADAFLADSDTQDYVVRDDEGMLQIRSLMATRTGRSYILIGTTNELSRQDSHLVSGVVQIYRNFYSLVVHAQTDQLTGLANRKTFDDCVAKVYELLPLAFDPVAHERRHDQALDYWLVMVDIDHFKLVNDRFGHLYGDEVLVLLAQLMKKCFREDDMLFRFGGEEFVLIIRCPNQAVCWATLERFRATVEQTVFPQVGTVTISIGVIQMHRDIFTGTLLDRSDQALYHSKHNGRNQVTFYEDLISTGEIVEAEIKSSDIDFF